MKYLILFLISFSTFAGYMSKVDIEDCEKSNRIFYLRKSSCVGECYRIPKGYECEANSIVDEYIDDLDSPNYELKSSVVSCSDEADCIAKEAIQVCDSIDGYFIVRTLDEVYCTKLISYDQKLSGNKIIAEDATKKADHELAKAAKKLERDSAKAQKKAAKDYFKALDCSILSSAFEVNVCNFIKR